jgi:hypothetical protein
VKLVGWCDGGAGKQLLVYELVKNKSVDEHLHGPGRLLAWPERYSKIALGVGRAVGLLLCVGNNSRTNASAAVH